MADRALLWGLAAAAGLGALVLGRRVVGGAAVDALSEDLLNTLPNRLAQWSDQLARVAVDTCPDEWTPRAWALLLAAVMDRESAGGNALTPRGPGGTGDYGHGHGLMQIDDKTWGAWLAANDWTDPEVNIRKGAEILAANIAAAASTENAVAAYNAGPRALNAMNPDRFTTGKDYSADVLRRAEQWA